MTLAGMMRILICVSALTSSSLALTTCDLLDDLFPQKPAGDKQLTRIKAGLTINETLHYPTREELFRLLYHGQTSPYAHLATTEEEGRRLGSAQATKETINREIRTILGHRPRFIIEVGSFVGGSASQVWGPMVQPTGGMVLCVDTWQGDVNMRLGPAFQEAMQLKNGFPNLWTTFMSRMIESGMADTVFPLSMPSLTAARLLAVLHWKIDVAYVDSAHEQGETLIELHMYYQLLRPGGVLLGDDYEW
eukprot:CAMPEP_0206171114 /NCGR_PEP_ID=MMETSP1474-20131121/41239_1 /ASSEMBLY_ACC=CAM_ASM_001110 /TAXON_ID=97495 /ORGANISM="Imantonia sp., Strain RCC918" /LENGTH=247 /DNA_ID=CAMNT_0053578293 /DNA_START=264 /DNA_END=1004 /DNA_ORIENTATION=-